MQDRDTLMDFAARLAERAGEITLQHFGRVDVEYKGDGSEVTAADRASEAYILGELRERFPADGILGEEGAAAESRSGRRWVIDPIDGTRSFSSGIPLYGVLLALEEAGTPVLGCAHFPALGQTVVAARGAGAWLNGAPARVSDCDRLAEARLVTSGLEYWRDWASPAGKAGLEALIARTRFARTWGDAYGYTLVATGRADLMADPAVGATWDCAPLIPILQEAGGRFTAIDGGPMAAWRTALASNGRLHAAAAACWPAGPDADRHLQSEAMLRRRDAE